MSLPFVVKHATCAAMGPPWDEEDEQWPREYRSYSTHAGFNSELLRLARRSPAAALQGKIQASSVTLQPFVKPASTGNEDRHVVERWTLASGIWTFAGIFDGHAGHETADYTLASLPALVRGAVEPLVASSSAVPSHTAIASALSDTIQAFDKSIADDLASIIPPDFDCLTDEELKALVNDQASGGANYAKVLRCMRGCTCLIALVDPSGENLWVANLGDCQAVLGQADSLGNVSADLLTSLHNGGNPEERERLKKGHPGEEEAVLKNRVLGALATFRALGDHAFKLPAAYTYKVFLNAEPGFRIPAKVREFIARSLTPPYVSSLPDVVHRALQPSNKPRSLIICSDGLTDMYEHRGTEKEVVQRWAQIVCGDMTGEEHQGLDGDKALALLKDGLGPTLEKASLNLTVDMSQAWLDDTTIVVLSF